MMRKTLLLATVATAACGTAPTAPRPTLAVFRVQTKQLTLRRGVPDRLQRHATDVVSNTGAFKVVPYEKVLRTLKRRRRRSERRCHSLRCQVKLGNKRLDVKRSLTLKITKNLAHQCDVIGTVYDLTTKEVDLDGRTRAGCALEEVVRSINQVVCHIAEAQRQADRQRSKGPPPRAVPKQACMAQAELAWIDSKLEAKKPKRRRRRRKQPGGEQMAERLLDFKREYDQVSRFGPRWKVAATCRTGRLYEHFADKMERMTASVPRAVRRQGKEAIAGYEKQQITASKMRAAPFRDKAVQLYRECLKKAEDLEIPTDDRYINQARARLERIEAGAAAKPDPAGSARPAE